MWEWLECCGDDKPVAQFVRKLDIRGVMRCELCNRDINYNGRG